MDACEREIESCSATILHMMSGPIRMCSRENCPITKRTKKYQNLVILCCCASRITYSGTFFIASLYLLSVCGGEDSIFGGGIFPFFPCFAKLMVRWDPLRGMPVGEGGGGKKKKRVRWGDGGGGGGGGGGLGWTEEEKKRG